jgi:hypothetical protein
MATDEENGSRTTEEERRRNEGMTNEEEKAHREIHRNMNDQELQNIHDRVVNNTAEGKTSEFAQKEEQLVREELAKRGREVKADPSN